MRKVIMTILALSALVAQSALADNLGVISDEKKPQNLMPASEIVKNLTAPAVATTDRSFDCDFDDFGFGLGLGLGFDRWWGGRGYWPYYGYYYPYYNYYYPYYGYG